MSTSVISPTLAPRRLAASYRSLLSNASREEGSPTQPKALDNVSASALRESTLSVLDAHNNKRRKIDSEKEGAEGEDGKG